MCAVFLDKVPTLRQFGLGRERTLVLHELGDVNLSLGPQEHRERARLAALVMMVVVVMVVMMVMVATEGETLDHCILELLSERTARQSLSAHGVYVSVSDSRAAALPLPPSLGTGSRADILLIWRVSVL